MPREFIPSGDYHYSKEIESWIWWEIWDDGIKYVHRWNQANNTTEWLDVPNKLWNWKADGKQVPADALAHYEANQKREWNKRFYTDDKAYLDEPPLRWNGIILHMNGWNADGSPKYWNGQGAVPASLDAAVPFGPEREHVLNAARRAHQDYAYQQAVPAKGWTVNSTSPMWQPRYGGQKRVTNRRRRNKSIRRRRNKSIRRRRN
jgi:hypothetical protein